MRNFIYSTLNWAWKGNPPIVFFGILLGDNCFFYFATSYVCEIVAKYSISMT